LLNGYLWGPEAPDDKDEQVIAKESSPVWPPSSHIRLRLPLLLIALLLVALLLSALCILSCDRTGRGGGGCGGLLGLLLLLLLLLLVRHA